MVNHDNLGKFLQKLAIDLKTHNGTGNTSVLIRLSPTINELLATFGREYNKAYKDKLAFTRFINANIPSTQSDISAAAQFIQLFTGARTDAQSRVFINKFRQHVQQYAKVITEKGFFADLRSKNKSARTIEAFEGFWGITFGTPIPVPPAPINIPKPMIDSVSTIIRQRAPRILPPSTNRHLSARAALIRADDNKRKLKGKEKTPLGKEDIADNEEFNRILAELSERVTTDRSLKKKKNRGGGNITSSISQQMTFTGGRKKRGGIRSNKMAQVNLGNENIVIDTTSPMVGVPEGKKFLPRAIKYQAGRLAQDNKGQIKVCAFMKMPNRGIVLQWRLLAQFKKQYNK